MNERIKAAYGITGTPAAGSSAATRAAAGSSAAPRSKSNAKPTPAAQIAAAAGEPARLEAAPWLKKNRVYYDDASGLYWRWVKAAGWISYNEGQFRRLLKCEGFQGNAGKFETASQVDSLMLGIQHDCRLDFAGAIAGYTADVHEICGQRILIPKGPRIPTPRRGRWDTIKAFLAGLLEDDARYFYAWIKAAAASLAAGFPWRPGQLLAIAGPVGSGKSLLQNLITLMLGGRSCKPYGYLTGTTNFNSNYFACEHWMIEDEASSTDIRIRRTFGAMIKNVIVNQVQNFHAKGRDALSVTPFLRMTISLNDTPDSLLVLPPLEEDICDKIILLRAQPMAAAAGGESLEARAKFWAALTGEIPAFLSALSRWEVPKHIRDRRYGVRPYQNAELLELVQALSQERRLLNLIDTCGFWEQWQCGWEGTAFELETQLREIKAAQGEVSRLLPYHTLGGIFLRRLANSEPKRVKQHKGKDRANTYKITPPTWD